MNRLNKRSKLVTKVFLKNLQKMCLQPTVPGGGIPGGGSPGGGIPGGGAENPPGGGTEKSIPPGGGGPP